MRKKKDDLSDFLTSDLPEEVSISKKEKSDRPGLFDYVKDLSYEKKNLAGKIKEETGNFPSEYVPYVVMKAFGNAPDTVLIANELNIRFSEIDTESQYQFFLYAIPKKRRFNKFFSEDKDRTKQIQALSKYFETGYNDARTNLKMFSKNELDYIVSLYEDKNK